RDARSDRAGPLDGLPARDFGPERRNGRLHHRRSCRGDRRGTDQNRLRRAKRTACQVQSIAADRRRNGTECAVRSVGAYRRRCLACRILGYLDPKLCLGMQASEFWFDTGTDAKRGFEQWFPKRGFECEGQEAKFGLDVWQISESCVRLLET